MASFASFIFAIISAGIFFRRIAIIGRERIEHFLVPDPVLQHLRGRFDEIRRDVRAGETRILGVRHDGVEGVAEFVEERFDVLVSRGATACPGSAAGNYK